MKGVRTLLFRAGLVAVALLLAESVPAFAASPFNGVLLFPNGARGPDGKLVNVGRPMNGAWPKGTFAPLLDDLRQGHKRGLSPSARALRTA